MLQNVSTLTVLLVCVISETAHAASYQWGWEGLPARSKRSTRNGVSVVENWISVCEEVCGAGYGGLGCNCDADTYTPGHLLLKANLHGMCPVLCENQLGTSNCDCPSAIGIIGIDNNKTSVERNRDRLCSESCKWKLTKLKGCSSCSVAADDTTTDSQFTDDDNGSNSDTSESNDNEDTTSDEDATTEEETTTEESTTEESTTESTTTPTTTQPTTTRSTTPATTTPDWSQLCEALCRNGDGGSFCNCDIPPFF